MGDILNRLCEILRSHANGCVVFVLVLYLLLSIRFYRNMFLDSQSINISFMKKEARFINIPTSLWENQDLSWTAKIVLMEIDSYPRSELGVNVRAGAVATALGITKKECDTALKELFDKGAVQVNIDDGQKLLLPLIYKDRYLATGQIIPEGEKPSNTNSIDYDEVAKQWAEICPMLPPINRFTPQRKRKLKACLNQAELTYGDLIKCFRVISVTPFLNGTGGFAAHFDWVIQKSQNLQKIYEGFYSRSISEKNEYERIMRGEDVTAKNNDSNEDYWQ